MEMKLKFGNKKINVNIIYINTIILFIYNFN